jgi:hypothetical protein
MAARFEPTRCAVGAIGILVFTFTLHLTALGQQFAVNEAGIGDRNACQFEAWHGQSESWISPACHLIPDFEVAVGIGLVDDGGSSRDLKYAVEGRYSFRSLRPNDFAIGLIAGIGVDPRSPLSAGLVPEYFAYVPTTISLFDDRSHLHGNLGWTYHGSPNDMRVHAHDHAGHHAFTWGLRTDFWVLTRMALVAQVFGEDRSYPEVELGARFSIVPDRIDIDLSWGTHTEPGFSGNGLALGVSWTQPRLR